MPGEFELDPAAIQALFAAGGQVWVFVDLLTKRVATLAKLYAPVDTGFLRRSIIAAVVPDGPLGISGLVGATAYYAEWVHEGTRPHVIRPRTEGGVLCFTVAGRKVFATQVNHPGTRPRPFLRRALEAAMAGNL